MEQRAKPHCLLSPVLSGPLLLSRAHTYVVGRERGADILIRSARVSRQHAQIRFVPQRGFEVMDLGSTNGTVINGVPLKGGCFLHDGDSLMFGGYEVHLKVVDPGELEDTAVGATLAMRRRRRRRSA